MIRLKQINHISSIALENVNLKVRIDSLLFDILVDSTLLTSQVIKMQSIHNHSVFELHSIISGKGALIIGDQEQSVNCGDIYLIGPNVFHSLTPAKNEVITHFTLRFTFRIDERHDAWFPADEADQIKAALSDVTFYRFFNPGQPHEIDRLMAGIQREIKSPSVGVYTNVQALFTQLIVQLVREIRLQTDTQPSSTHSFPHKVKDELRSRIIDQFFRDFREPLTIAMLADKLHLSVRQVNRLLRQDYHTTFKQKLLDNRVEKAKYLLRSSDMSVQRIAEEVGYATADNFTRIFHKKTGLTPSEFRKMKS